MSDVTYLGNCSNIIDINQLLKNLGTPDTTGPTASLADEEISEIFKIWKSVGYDISSNSGTVKWDMYFPDQSFDRSIIMKILNHIGFNSFNSAWISKIDPGYCAAPHYDRIPVNISPNRMHIHLEDSCMGHVFYIGNTYLTGYKQGDIFLWNDPYAWHAGSNISLKPKFMLNIY